MERFRAVLGWVTLCLAGCAGANGWTDLGSVSTGAAHRGRIRSPARMPQVGPGWRIPPRWIRRGFNYGTDELVAAVQRAGGRVWAGDRGAVLGVADFSRRSGGRSAWHRSHHSGRDVDLLFYTRSPRGRPMPPPPESMVRFDAKGRSVEPDPQGAARRFDTRRNWQLLEALLSDASIRVQWIFVSNDLRALLLRWARRHQRPRWIVEYARTVMRQPDDSSPHDDHFHVRVYCSRSDRFHGCEDTGPVWRHEKKAHGYPGPERYDPVAWRLLLGPPRMLL